MRSVGFEIFFFDIILIILREEFMFGVSNKYT